MSDVGMCGPYNGILGSSRDAVIKKTWTNVPTLFEVEQDDEYLFSAVELVIDEDSMKVVDFKNIYLILKEREISHGK